MRRRGNRVKVPGSPAAVSPSSKDMPGAIHALNATAATGRREGRRGPDKPENLVFRDFFNPQKPARTGVLKMDKFTPIPPNRNLPCLSVRCPAMHPAPAKHHHYAYAHAPNLRFNLWNLLLITLCSVFQFRAMHSCNSFIPGLSNFSFQDQFPW